MAKELIKSGKEMITLIRGVVDTTPSREVFMRRARKLIQKHCPTEHETAMVGCAVSIGSRIYGNNFTRRASRITLPFLPNRGLEQETLCDTAYRAEPGQRLLS